MRRTIEILEKTKSDTVSPDEIFEVVCRDVSSKTGANRVSIWHFENDNDCIRCDCFYEAEKEKFSKGQTIYAADQPKYFETITTEMFVVAPDARNHVATENFTNGYFKEHDIHSLLDFVLSENYQPVGMICCENAGKRLDWQNGDLSYLRSISAIISFYFKRQ